ncbi:MAG: TauD/TfdA family dioxygenase [Ramlibacter sp.]|jgi:taurine dioxygenase|nr:TauD/TfdA family dioxygenase [Ramlibacter sp.]
MSIKTAPLSYGLGVEVLDVDLASPMSDAVFGEIRQAFLAHDGLLLLRNQAITREQHIAFSRRFGDLDTHDAVPLDRHPQYHELLMVANEPVVEGLSNGRYIGQQWHSDLAPSLRPAMGSLLRAVQVPSAGGDTMFTNMYAAYDGLSEGMKKLVADLHGVHVRGRKNVSAEWEANNRRINPPVAQPVVRVHPETGRKALYIGEAVQTFEAMTQEESRPIIDFLIRHATRPQFGYRHRWRNNDIVMWDNRCTMHLALGDYDQSQRRHLERTTVLGTPSGHICELAA